MCAKSSVFARARVDALSAGLAVAGEKAARERAPRDHADALRAHERHHLALFLAIDQVVVVLHRRRSASAVPIGEIASTLRELPRVHGRRADVARLARAHDVVERLERLLDRRLRVEAMDLVEVDVVDAEPAQAVVDGVLDVLAREPAMFGSSPIG